MTDPSAKSNQGKRYTPAEKAEIAEFIAAYNAEHKRGGKKHASDKFGVSVVTLSNWSKQGKASKKRKAKAKAKVKRSAAAKVVKKVVTPPPSKATSRETALKRMQLILVEIAALEKEYTTLKKVL